ncbi:CopG family transcriptional regulator [Candidatus Acetothermia bacterium]|nr:MAG: CopG family transcriptional regulator [Candidatus Acetothermia bacterium]HHK67050.1 ribbon-helix-helix protein, CopG family [Candidatus Acetothermia bacterium]
MGNTVKLTISLPADLVRLTDETAQMEKKPRSRVIKEALTHYIKEKERQEMIEGYQEMAALNRELAEESEPVVNEVWADYGHKG